MKKIVPLFLVASVIILGFGCETCEQCSYSYIDSGGQEISADVGEACGTQEDLDQLELECETAAQIVNGDCTCN